MCRRQSSFRVSLLLSAFLGAFALISTLAAGHAQTIVKAGEAWMPSEFREPVTLASKDGVLEVKLTAHQGKATLDTVAKPVENFLLFDYEVIKGTASDGTMSGGNLYPAPTLQVFPGEKLIVHMDNALTDLTIADYFSPQYTPTSGTVPTYPIQMTSSPLNLHVHGLHVSPKGNSDNVMLHIGAGMSNTYKYDIPSNMPHGAYWYHSHLHTLTSAQVYTGLVGILSIGRLDGNLPLVTEKKIPIRNMALQYNFVFGRAGGLAQLNNANWSQYVSTAIPPAGDQLTKGTYRPSLAPVNFAQSAAGTIYPTVWWAGPLAIENRRGLTQTIPSNLITFTGENGRTVPADPTLPDWKRDVQFTVNGLFEPIIKSKAGQTEIWVLENVSDFAYMPVQLTETATGRHPQIAIVGQDGNPYPAVHYPIEENGTRLVISPASRFAIAVTIPEKGDLVLEMPPLGYGAKTINTLGVLYTSNGAENYPAELGSLSVAPTAVSYVDGFFAFPSQLLARAVPSEGKGQTTPFIEGQKLNAYTSFVELGDAKPDVTRKILINGGFLNDKATVTDPKSFVYAFDSVGFPNTPLIQPRLNSVEEWQFINHNNDEHPIHVHVNDFQVVDMFDPTVGLRTGVQHWGEDNVNVPAPTMGAGEGVVQAGTLSMRTRFDDYTGLYVMHCHRLNHEDNGLMALINVIPAVSSYAVAVAGTDGKATEIRVFDGRDDKPLATVVPFPAYSGPVSVSMGDVDGDGVLDLVVGAGKNHAPEIVVYSGHDNGFPKELARFQPFARENQGGVSVTAAQIDGTAADNIVVGSGPGAPSEVKVFSTRVPTAPGTAPALFSTFKPFADNTTGVSVASGFVDFATGRNSIVTASGPGSASMIKVFVFPLTTPIAKDGASRAAVDKPLNTVSFTPFADNYQGGVSLATGWLAGQLGGAKRIIVGQLAGKGTV
jgi:FtsP/CotA-like multicopper oxidase with cupredoxin domain